VSPPETWDPSERLAADLLKETTTAPWLQPVQLESLTDQKGGVARKPLASNKVNWRELSATYLTSVRKAGAQLNEYSSMLDNPLNGYKTQLAEALAATESSAWRGGGTSAAAGAVLLTGLDQYLDNAEHKVKIIPPGEIPMAGASGLVPVTIQNALERQTVRVKLIATVVTVRGYANTLTLGQQKLVTIPPGQVKLVKLSIHSARQGSTTINLSLANADGTVLPWTTTPPTQLTVNSTRYGQKILLLIAAAIGLLLLSSAIRSSRRRQAAASDEPASDGSALDESAADGSASEDSGSDEGPASGNVMTSTKDPTEAPDDLADARRWADDT
jgi:hypothetical protein